MLRSHTVKYVLAKSPRNPVTEMPAGKSQNHDIYERKGWKGGKGNGVKHLKNVISSET